ncbi:alpha-galactosidase A [Xylaria castorea]|nr:alpha-galactosidase A [Xylaria castorea]
MELPRLISMEVSSNGRFDFYYRILANRSVRYIAIKAGALNAEALDDMPLDFQTCITRDPSSGQLETTLSLAELPGVETIWHPRIIGSLDIERTKRFTLLAQECKYKTESSPKRAVAKMARFHWEVQYMEAETRMYQVLEGQGIAPEFFGHVHEAGRAIGFLLEKVVDGRNAESSDLEICKATLHRFHTLGFMHGDCNKYNFIIRPDGRAVLIDFDHSKFCTDPAPRKAEIASL